MRKVLIACGVSLCVLTAHGQSTEAGVANQRQTVQGVSAGSPQPRVAMLLSGLEQEDFKKVFDVTFAYQAKVQEIQAQNPQVMWQRLIDEYYEATRSAFLAPPATGRGVIGSLLDNISAFSESLSGAPEDPAKAPIRSFLKPKPRWKILEVRTLPPVRDQWSGKELAFSLVYVQLNYGDAEMAPIFKGSILKETILGIRMESKSRLYWSAQVVPQSEAYWANSPFRILSVQWQMVFGEGFGQFDTIVSYNILGGTPPYQSSTRCGTMDLEALKEATVSMPKEASVYGSPLEDPKSHISIRMKVHFGRTAVMFPLTCTATVTDSRNAQDTVSFVVPRAHTNIWEAYCWIREPWYGWGQGRPIPRGGCSELRELTTAKRATLSKP